MRELSKAYEAKQYEDGIYDKWEKSGLFNPDVCVRKKVTKKNAKPFSIVLPPPNVTGTLHMGHAVMLAIQDVMIRYHRMKGDKTLWLPGTDHAAIATQSKVESLLYEKEKKTRHDLGREEFLKRVEQFAQESHDTIVNQCKKMGASLDWSREAFTLDEARNLAVRTVFKKMFDDGVIYRGDRIVNWDAKMQSNVADDELEWREEKAPFYYFQYGPFVIGTVRPETKFGDKYVVMHPDDKRYAKYKDGQKIHLEWINGPIVATIVKDKAVDPAFGTGVMTITPWHTAIDFDIAERHGLEKEQVIGYDGKLLPIAGEFAGMDAIEARPKIVEKLKQKGLLVKTDDAYVHNVAVNYRGGGVIEPQIRKQWFISVNKKFRLPNSKIKGFKKGQLVTLKQLMQTVVRKHQIDIIPDRFNKTYFHWIDNLRDWCISRQIWYGHRVPVWYCLSCKATQVNPIVKAKWYLVRHGETDWNKEKKMQGQQDIPLNDVGRKQVAETVQYLKKLGVEAIFTSDLKRAHETAECIQAATGAELVVDRRLRERMFGKGEGMSYQDARKTYPEMFRYHGKSADAGNETCGEAEDRMWSIVSEHLQKHRHRNVAIVSHGNVLRCLIRKIKNIDPNLFDSIEPIPNAHPIQLDILERPCEHCGNHFFEQDPDTLDTWFSAGIWTFSTLGWPKNSKDLQTYHPTSVLETGYDILFFWVARMILMTTYALGDIPFEKVYLHGLVRDEQGRKMSKSLGNIINPLDMIAKYGTDATRLSLLLGNTPGTDMKLSEAKVAGFRNFTNKLWNISRFMLLNIKSPKPVTRNPKPVTLADRWILARLSEVTKQVTEHLENYNFSMAGEILREFTWGDLADWYLEIAKIEGDKDAILNYLLNTILKLWHPFMPFVTETIWGEVYGKKGMLMVEEWPVVSSKSPDKKGLQHYTNFISLIQRIRVERAEKKIPPSTKVNINVSAPKELVKVLKENTHVFKELARLEEVRIGSDANASQVFFQIDYGVDKDMEIARIRKDIATVEPYVVSLEKKLGNGQFVENAPADVVANEKRKLVEAKEKLEKLRQQLSALT